MIPLNVVRLVDYAVFGIAGLFAIICFLAALFVVPWTGLVRKRPVGHNFNKYWKARVVMELTAALWLLSQWLRLGALWLPGSHIMPDSGTAWTRNGILCRIYLTVALGLLQPFFLLTVLLLCCSTLSRKKQEEGGWSNAATMGGALALSFPVLLMQAAVAWLGVWLPKGSPGSWEEHPGTLLHYFLAAYTVAPTKECGTRKNRCALCAFPAAACIISLAFSVLYIVVIWRVTHKMIAASINRRLRRRLRVFQVSVICVLGLSQALLGATVVTSSLEWPFEFTWVAYFLTMPILVSITTVLLVLLPVWDAWTATRRLPVMGQGDEETSPHELALLTKAGSDEVDRRAQGNGSTALLVADAT